MFDAENVVDEPQTSISSSVVNCSQCQQRSVTHRVVTIDRKRQFELCGSCVGDLEAAELFKARIEWPEWGDLPVFWSLSCIGDECDLGHFDDTAW